MAKKRFYFVAVGLLAVFLVGIAGTVWWVFYQQASVRTDSHSVVSAIIRDVPLKLDVSDTSELRTRGLSRREELLPGTGMLFIFEQPGKYGFWMKDMQFSLDIIWFDSGYRAIYLQKNVAPETYPEIFTPPVPAQYVLEVPAGFVDNSGISIGDFLDVKTK